jgi:23S rRNA pseudouridine1911/1915/1917 synthase
MADPLVDMHVPQALAGERLDRVIPQLCPQVSRSHARRLIEGGAVFVDRRRARVCSRPVKGGERLTCYELFTPPADRAHSSSTGQPRIVLSTPELMIMDKPAGMPVEPTRSGIRGTVAGWLEERGEPAFITHRLDAATSGLLLVARTRPAQVQINGLLSRHAIRRRYLAVVSPPPAEGPAPTKMASTIEAPLDGRPARTLVTLAARSPRAALLVVELETGRWRQIRRHLAQQGTPVVGDRATGGGPASRLLLHASHLQLRWQGEALACEAPLPPEFRAELERLELSAEGKGG